MPRKAELRSKPTTPADVAVPVDAKLKARWDAALAEVGKAKARGASAFDELYEAVGAIIDHDPPLYVLGGYASVKEFAAEVLGEKARTVQRNVRVARFASPRDEDKYGVTKLDAATRATRASAGTTRAKKPSALFRALTAGLSGEAFAATTVRETNGMLSFTGVPVGALAAFVRALGAAARQL